MARPKADFPAPADIRALADGEGRLALRVTPGASRDGLAIEDGRLRARVSAAPEGGKANKAVIRLVGKALGVAPSAIILLRGDTSREKLLQIPD